MTTQMNFTNVIRHILLCCCLLLTLLNCGTKTKPTAPLPVVQVATVVQKDTPIYSDWVATLDGLVNEQIQPRVSGYIIKQNYVEGAFVTKGTVLFEIDPRPFVTDLDHSQAQLAQAEAQLSKTKLDVERDTPMAQARAIPRSQLDNDIEAESAAEAQVKAAKADVEQAKLNLDFTKVTTLISGVAGIAQVQIGNLVGPSSVLTSVSQVDPIKAYVTVDEQTYTEFHRRFPTEQLVAEQRKRMPLQLILSDGRVYEHTGTITFADRQVNPATGAIRIAATFPNPNNLLRPGEFGRIRLSANTQKGALLIPQRAVIELQGSHQVAVVGSDNKVSIRPVTVGDRVGNLWIVTAGLKPGERVVVEGLMKVKDGSSVQIAPPETAENGV
jgi:RND family efflux transporter MFP subunit